jgi:hypothetical protein
VPDLNFTVEKAEAVRYAATPLLGFMLRVTNADPDEVIHTATLRCQIQIEVARRRYGSREQGRLRDLFGEPDRWGHTLRPMLWAHASTVVPQFSGNIAVLLPVACTFDFNVAATKYFHGVEGGEVPLSLMFSGTVFYSDKDGALQVAPISWDKESRFRLPVAVWKEVMDLYYPNSAWLSLRRDVFDRLYQHKVQQGIPTWEETLERLLAPCEETVPS